MRKGVYTLRKGLFWGSPLHSAAFIQHTGNTGGSEIWRPHQNPFPRRLISPLLLLPKTLWTNHKHMQKSMMFYGFRMPQSNAHGRRMSKIFFVSCREICCIIYRGSTRSTKEEEEGGETTVSAVCVRRRKCVRKGRDGVGQARKMKLQVDKSEILFRWL